MWPEGRNTEGTSVLSSIIGNGPDRHRWLRDNVLPPGNGGSTMPQKAQDYRRHMHDCMTRAELSASKEIQDLWDTIAASYRFLLQREERIEAENSVTR